MSKCRSDMGMIMDLWPYADIFESFADYHYIFIMLAHWEMLLF